MKLKLSIKRTRHQTQNTQKTQKSQDSRHQTLDKSSPLKSCGWFFNFFPSFSFFLSISISISVCLCLRLLHSTHIPFCILQLVLASQLVFTIVQFVISDYCFFCPRSTTCFSFLFLLSIYFMCFLLQDFSFCSYLFTIFLTPIYLQFTIYNNG